MQSCLRSVDETNNTALETKSSSVSTSIAMEGEEARLWNKKWGEF